jgi:hypothetical protein
LSAAYSLYVSDNFFRVTPYCDEDWIFRGALEPPSLIHAILAHTDDHPSQHELPTTCLPVFLTTIILSVTFFQPTARTNIKAILNKSVRVELVETYSL